jgi:hypothetical protein
LARRGQPRTSRAKREQNERWRNEHTNRYLYNSAKYRAKKHGLPFNITPDDITIPDECPALGIPLFRGSGKGRMIPKLPDPGPHLPQEGVRQGQRDRRQCEGEPIKNNASAMELIQVALFYKRLIDKLANTSHRR